jgi:hypothetical protein
MHDFRLLADEKVQYRRVPIPDTECNSGRFKKVIDDLVQFAARLASMIAMQKYDYRQWPRITLIRVADDESHQAAKCLFSGVIAPEGATFKVNRLQAFGEHGDGSVPIRGGQQIEMGFAVITPMGYSDAIQALKFIESGTEEWLVSSKFCRGSDNSAFVADHYHPQNDGPGVMLRSRIEGSDGDFAPVIKKAKVAFL